MEQLTMPSWEMGGTFAAAWRGCVSLRNHYPESIDRLNLVLGTKTRVYKDAPHT